MTFAEYVQLMRPQPATPGPQPGEAQVKEPFASLLYQRLMRNLQTYVVSEELKGAVMGISTPQTWMVVTEPWCGDSSQIVPLIHKIAQCNPLVTLDLVLRDQHPEIMDAYLTDGKRSIPKLVGFGGERRELFRWGPRPRRAQEIFDQAMAEGQPKQTALEKVHLFYAKDRGAAVDAELLGILQGQGLD